MKNKSFLLSLLCMLVFFIVGFLTLKDYGVSWDEAIHFRRGQAYLHFFLTGQKDYSNLPSYDLQGTEGLPQNIPIPRRSFYQNDYHNGYFFFKNDAGHPPLNDITAAFLNFIFFQKLGILSDVESYHLFNLLSASLLIFCVVYFAAITLGVFAALISFVSLIVYPLFFAEAHFNIKDPAEAAFFSLTILSIYQFVLTKKYSWYLTSFIGFGLALSIKFNILFLPLIVLPFLYFELKNIKNELTKSRFWIFTLLGILIALSIFVGSWPYLWSSPLVNLAAVFKYYQEIGSGFNYQPGNFYFLGFNFFPILWLIFTTPPTVLVLGFIGTVSVLVMKKNFHHATVLWLAWFLVPILRVMFPGSSIYGGVRQIMEFLPAMCLLAGLGAYQLVKLFNQKYKQLLLIQIILLLLFIWPLIVLIKMHPYQNVYFNQLIGGLKGAQDKNFPSWGNSLGSVYLEGIRWLNKNAEPKSKVSLIQGTPANAPVIYFRKDLKFDNSFWSGIHRNGEYLMDLTFNDTGKDFYYAWDYVENFLIPVYEVKVDGVPILKIWKNDLAHTKDQYKLKEVAIKKPVVEVKKDKVIFKLDKTYSLSRLELTFLSNKDCQNLKTGFIETSLDNINWSRQKDSIPFKQVHFKDNLKQDRLVYYFPAVNAQFIRLNLDSEDSCLLKDQVSTVTILTKI